MNYILGSGIVALLAKHILPGDWTIVKYGKSRFYSFNPPLDDGLLVKDPRLDDYYNQFCNSSIPIFVNRGISYYGQIVNFTDEVIEVWLDKVYGNDHPRHARMYWKTHMSLSTYDISAGRLYNILLNKYRSNIEEGGKIGKITSISDHYFMCGDKRYDFEKLVSTIPFDALSNILEASNKPSISYKNSQIINLQTDVLDFEGKSQLLVADHNIPFYKVDKLLNGSYIFYFNGEVPNPALALMSTIKKFNIINGTMVPNYITMGGPIESDQFKKLGVYLVGGYSLCDSMIDINCSLLKLLDTERWFK